MKTAYLITDYGAVPGNELCTEKIQAAIDACYLNGGGNVVVPAGVFTTGGIRLRSDVTLYLKKGAILRGSRDPEDYFAWKNDKVEPLKDDEITDIPFIHCVASIKCPTYTQTDSEIYDYKRKPGSRWNNALIRAIHAENIAVIGEEGSVIDGADCFDEKGEERYRGPHGIHFFDCRNIRFSGYTFKNSSNWSHKCIYCDNIICENITVLAGHDGVHMNACNNAVVRNSVFHTGDDCIAGFGSSNIVVDNCILNTACNSVRLGATNAVIKNCRMYGPGEYLFRGSLTDEEKRNGAPSLNDPNDTEHEYYLRCVFNYYGEYNSEIPLQPGNILFTDCVFENARRFMLYDFGNHPCQVSRPLDNVTFRNIKATGIETPLVLYGNKDIPVSLNMDNVSIEVADNFQWDALIYASDFKSITLDNVTASGKLFSAVVDEVTEGNCTFNNVIVNGKEQTNVRKSDKKSAFSIC